MIFLSKKKKNITMILIPETTILFIKKTKPRMNLTWSKE